MINRQRISDEFARQAAIASPSFREGQIAAYLAERLTRMGAEVVFDATGPEIGSESGNLIARFAGTKDGAPFMLSGHMDTVTPADGVEPVLQDGVFRSKGETILGADDKAGLAEIFEAIEVIKEQRIPHVPLEVVITVCEEIGLLGAKHLDFTKIESKWGVALDTNGINRAINMAPAANRMTIKIFGQEAHAGVAPETGISAIQIVAKAIARMDLGRVDVETTANIGVIEGGQASNIIPKLVTLKAEVRSHDPDKLRLQTEKMLKCLEEEVDAATIHLNGKAVHASLSLEITDDYPRMHVKADAPVLKLVTEAGAALGRPVKIDAAGGGSDANIFNGHGIETVILGSGMEQVHSVDENVSVDDMVAVTELLVEMIRRA
ncbi:MAG: M20/M25/M40 family metallo-hydrolase [Desulfuromonadales bacterium]|nr:M20/M25/M40 family metallo-hydrolase [Desulfuromonadales bacterium]